VVRCRIPRDGLVTLPTSGPRTADEEPLVTLVGSGFQPRWSFAVSKPALGFPRQLGLLRRRSRGPRAARVQLIVVHGGHREGTNEGESR
jgi:hypothetical protein